MKWVRIEDGCEMPEDGEIFIICDDHGDWRQACKIGNAFFAVDNELYTDVGVVFDGATHWARVELPEECECCIGGCVFEDGE